MPNPATPTNADFNRFRHLIYDVCGVHLSDSKRELLRCRLGKRMARLGLETFRSYWGHVTGDATSRELLQVVDAITTNKTDFFFGSYLTNRISRAPTVPPG